MQIVVLGLNHRRATLALRESLVFPAYDLGPALEAMKRYVPEGAILSTCHRVELYAAAADAHKAEAGVKQFWSKQRGVPVSDFEPYVYNFAGRRAVEHLFNVACGLDSIIIGEPQILGQVREALRQGLEHHSVGSVLSALFRQAITAGKRARTETSIGRSASSISSAAVELVRQALGDLRSSRVLLVGTGEMGELAAKNLVDSGVAGLSVVGRTPERAQQLARQCGSAVALSRLEDALHECDIVITCTSAPHHVIRKEMVEQAMRERRGRPIFLVDIAMPRDVEPSVGDIHGVKLYNVDDLESAVAANMKGRRVEAQKVSPIVEQEVATFQRWLATRRVVPTISALRARAEAIRQSELARTSAVLARLSEADRQRIEALTLAIAKKLLHRPITSLRAEAASGHGQEAAQALHHLFGLEIPKVSHGEDEGELTSGAAEALYDVERGWLHT